MANEVNAGGSSSETNTSTPVKKKFTYKSPLCGLRSVNNPSTDKGFKPIGVSSPKNVNNGTGDRFALNVEAPPVNKPDMYLESDQARTPRQGPPFQGHDSGVVTSMPSLTGRGGNWRGPRGNDMTPDHRNHKNRHGYRSGGSPAPDDRGGQWNTPQQHSGRHRGHNDSFGQNSFRGGPRQNNYGQNSYGHQQASYSPQSRFNSSDRSHNSSFNSSRGNRGGNHSKRTGGDISHYYHPSMTSDPWAALTRERLDESSFLMSPIKSPFMNLSNDTTLGTEIDSIETEVPADDDS